MAFETCVRFAISQTRAGPGYRRIMVTSELSDGSARQPTGNVVPTNPVLIVNPKSGNGRAAAIDLVPRRNGWASRR